ncbi:hypothetical protein VT84_28010 [Gemmata sp. SH-PL17]|uniref:YXWGXW repeat-containing protein n=1 Tax=Gemmata sp. SH-PL17 TaxID=1630693 RepID=UPI00078DE225|nr:YXWGXW repeat-containing protein [Gemmata sp. SH-PL17]AMV28281.1 hypothetical protein VT84_28010 [Gemmata sp. SH-PL17]
MMSHSHFARATALCAVFAFTSSGRTQDPVPLPLPVPPVKPERKVDPATQPVTVVERGPVHEAFAQPSAGVRGRGITAPKVPPPPIDEVPPNVKVESPIARWIPGQWQWGADRADFVWVCGCYRNVPPGRTWEPGHWKEIKSEWTYFPGYWRPSETKTLLADLPEPPAPKDEAPDAKENPNAMWVPGIWERKDGRFEWQPGYWAPVREGVIWQQSQFVATETGFVFVSGYWDFALEERGLLYVPMYFSKAQRAKSGWTYRPEYVIPFGVEGKWGQGGTFDALYIGPNFNSYYYGNFSQISSNAAARVGFALRGSLSELAGPIIDLYGSSAYRPWNSVAPGYTNPLWLHYVRLNQNAPGSSNGTPSLYATHAASGFTPSGVACAPGGFAVVSATAVRPTRVTNTVSLSYQHVSRRGTVTTGTTQYRSSSPPFYPGWGRRY